MPTPILKIPVDDSAFQQYLQKFKKYQEQVEAQPEIWEGINTGINESAIAAGALAAMIADQAEETRKLTEAEEKREEARKRALEERRRQDKVERKFEEDAADRRKNAIKQVREYTRTVTSAAVDLGKYVLGGGLLASALGGFGLGNLAGWAGDERRLAGGLGVSMNQRQGLGINMQRYFDVNSTLERMGSMQANPADWGVFAMMGINPRGKTPADLAIEAAQATRRRYQESGGNLVAMQAMGYTRAFSLEDIRRLGTEDEGTFRKSIKDSRNFAALSEETGRKWQNFMARVEETGLKLKGVLADKLTTLEPHLEKLITKFGELALKVLDRIDFDALGEGLETFTKYITGPEFKRDLKNVAEDFTILAQKLRRLLEILGVLPDRDGGFFPDGRPKRPGDDLTSWAFGQGAVQKYYDVQDAVHAKVSDVGKWFGNLFGSEKSNGTLADRNNNPGNMIDPKTGKFRKYATLEEGASAMARQLVRNYDRGQNTVESLINHPRYGWSNQWSPGNSAASTGAYIRRVSDALGVAPNEKINLRDDRTLKRLMIAMNEVERGGKRGQTRTAGAPPATRGYRRATPEVVIKNQTGASVATNANAAVSG